MWTDIHCHLNLLDIPPGDAIERAKQAGVQRMITIGTCPEDHPVVLELCQKYQPIVYGTLGVHPHEAKLYGSSCEDFMCQHLLNPRIVALAEIGLDYYYDQSPRDVQKKVFRRQLEIAKELDMPIQVHTRDAEEDTIEILKEFDGKIKGVIHCFTGTSWLAEQALALGLNLSISGVVTFKNAQSLRDVVAATDLERLHVETDSPFLAPVPNRGKKNEPSYVVHTAELVSDLKGVSLEFLAEQTEKNLKQVFSKVDRCESA